MKRLLLILLVLYLCFYAYSIKDSAHIKSNLDSVSIDVNGCYTIVVDDRSIKLPDVPTFIVLDVKNDEEQWYEMLLKFDKSSELRNKNESYIILHLKSEELIK